MSEAHYSVERDLTEAQALADHLVPYVYENQIYGSIGGMFGSTSMPTLTIGALLMRLRRLHALSDQLSEAQRAELAQIDATNENARKEWSVHYTEKLTQEAISRLKMMDQYFHDCVEDPRSCANNYLPEALRRTTVEEIRHALHQYGTPNADVDRTTARVDGQLRRFTRPGDFIWAHALQPVYPEHQYWWLYAMPPRVTTG